MYVSTLDTCQSLGGLFSPKTPLFSCSRLSWPVPCFFFSPHSPGLQTSLLPIMHAGINLLQHDSHLVPLPEGQLHSSLAELAHPPPQIHSPLSHLLLVLPQLRILLQKCPQPLQILIISILMHFLHQVMVLCVHCHKQAQYTVQAF